MKRKWSKIVKIKACKETIRELQTEKLLLKQEVEFYKKLPVVDKEIILRLLEVVYAVKGGMASWGRR